MWLFSIDDRRLMYSYLNVVWLYIQQILVSHSNSENYYFAQKKIIYLDANIRGLSARYRS